MRANQDRDSGGTAPPPKWHTVTPSHKETLEWIDSLYGFITTHRALCDAHTVDFFTCKHWDKVIPERWKMEIGDDGEISDELLYNATPCLDEGSLVHFLHTARTRSIPLVWEGCSVPIPDQLARFGMTAKKSHEVASFSQYIAQLTSSKNIRQILDVGSGKGYLSQHLALKYGLCVVGMDAQQIHTEGAQRRNKKVYKAWKCISQPNEKAPTNSQTDTFIDNTPNEMNLSNLFEEQDTLASVEKCEENDSTCNAALSSTANDDIKKLNGVLHEMVTNAESPTTSLPTAAQCTLQTERQSYIPLTQTILTAGYPESSLGVSVEGDDGGLLERAEVDTCGTFSAQRSTCIVGLHTCGDLGGVALRLFLRQPQLNAVCVVGCCYHLLTEEVSAGCSGSQGFPMSTFLLSKNASLGRTARMLACQAASRVSTISTGCALESVFRRAVLQVILQRKYPAIYKTRCDTLRVGKMRKFPETFHEYAYIALEKLGLDTTCVSSEYVTAMYSEFKAKKSYLSTHLKLRAVLASCVESLLLLDRVLYLQEQDCINAVSLVQLFDPHISPRCFAIVASRPTTIT